MYSTIIFFTKYTVYCKKTSSPFRDFPFPRIGLRSVELWFFDGARTACATAPQATRLDGTSVQLKLKLKKKKKNRFFRW